MNREESIQPNPPPSSELPITGLLALTTASFIATANESVPAGLLPHISDTFEVSQAWAGQWVTACALGSGLAAVPLTLALQGWPRRLVLLLTVGVFCLCNAVTALSPYFALTLVARLIVGVATGVAWSLLAGYARRMVAAPLQGRAMAVAMLGIPVALALGVPLSAWLGEQIGWRNVFGLLAALSLALMVWIRLNVPDFAGQRAGQRLSLGHVLSRPGVRPVLTVVMLWIMAHYMLYTYIAAFLASVGLDGQVEQALLAFGIAALVGIWLTGLLIDRWLRRLVLLSLAGFALVSLALALGGLPAIAVYVAMAAWGLSYSGAPTLLQTALANAAADGADVAQSMLVTVLNLAFAGSAVVGGVLLETTGVGSIPWATLGLVLLAWLVVKVGGQAGFRSLSKP
ncbi:MFS transporter [Pseudomonas sp. D8002]|uniref:MFS transporter n=1 Tax=unclassified Pseudomonas TaxID=196821 RepID=UPI0015A45CFF|nr:MULTISPECIES: MFS transporter [unclassified Pseudomonas]NWA88954.1 MFS transporter [Pseudomonas sp. D8002]NWB23299.1 MFS transporter [Pseudomonas sp. D4002]